MKLRYLFVLLSSILISNSAFGATTKYEYDELDRLHIVTLENGQKITYEYDEIGNMKSKTVSGTAIDTTKPTITGFTIPTTSTTLAVAISSFTATDNFGVTGYLITESSTVPLATAAGWTATAPAIYTAATAGSHTLYPWAKDAAGNVSTPFAAPRTVVITLPDTTKPTITGFTIPTTSTTLAVAVSSFTATDNIAVTGYLITESSTAPLATAAGWTATAPAGYTAATVGSHTLYPWAKDAAGNVSALFATPRTVVITLPDTTAPTGSVSINAGATATNSTAATLTLTCSDAGGCSQMQFSNDNTTWSAAEAYAASKAWTLTTGAGTKTVYVKFKDVSNNWMTTAVNDTIILDTTAPATTAAPVGGTYTTAKSVTLTCSDGTGSGCDKIYYTTNGTTPTTTSSMYASALTISATSTLKYFAKDKAGNQEAVKSQAYTINIDSTPPTGTVLINAGSAITNSTAVTLNLTCNDTSGCSQMQFSNNNSTWSAAETYATSKAWTLATVNGTKTVYVKFKDVSGNWMPTAVNDTIVLDTTCKSPAKIVRATPVYYNTLAAAYAAAASGETIQLRNVTLLEGVSIGKSITLDGGYDCSYTSKTGTTTLKGSQISINSGATTLKDIVIDK